MLKYKKYVLGFVTPSDHCVVVFDVMNDREPNNTFIKSKSLAFDKKVCLQIRSLNFVD